MGDSRVTRRFAFCWHSRPLRLHKTRRSIERATSSIPNPITESSTQRGSL
jgi:hypothetical protein